MTKLLCFFQTFCSFSIEFFQQSYDFLNVLLNAVALFIWISYHLWQRLKSLILSNFYWNFHVIWWCLTIFESIKCMAKSLNALNPLIIFFSFLLQQVNLKKNSNNLKFIFMLLWHDIIIALILHPQCRMIIFSYFELIIKNS